MLSDLVVFEGGTAAIDSLSGSLQLITRISNLPYLIEVAQDNRADLQAAIKGRELSAANLRLARANRMIDLGLNVGFGRVAERNIEGEAPMFNAVSAGVSIPLKFSNMNRGELRAAQYAEQQAEAQYNAILLQIRKEVSPSVILKEKPLCLMLFRRVFPYR